MKFFFISPNFHTSFNKMDSICCVCKLNYQGSHHCSSCKMPCHAICGDAADEEGYGAQVVCFICKNKEPGIAAKNQSVATEDGEKDEDESQLYEDDDGILVDRKRHRHNDATKKLDAIEWARRNSINSTAKKFRVDRKSIREWMAQENRLKQQMNSCGGKRKRLDGGGRAVQHLNIDTTLADWIKEMRLNKRPVSRSIIKNKAAALFVDTDIKISNGWLEKFLKRHNFVLRRRTTAGQKPPANYAEAVAKFIIYVEQRRQKVNFTEIYAMDETAVWFDCPDNRCIETKGAKEVMVVTTGHEKMRVTVCLTASPQ